MESFKTNSERLSNPVHLPLYITYKLFARFVESEAVELARESTVSLSDEGGYSKLENLAKQLFKSRNEDLIGRKEVILLYGSCTIKGQNKYSKRLPLTSQEDWSGVIKSIMVEYLPRYSTQSLHLEILREYAAHQSWAHEKETLRDVMRIEIGELSRIASAGKKYVSRTDLEKLVTPAIIAEIINEDASISMDPRHNAAFISSIQSRFLDLFAAWVLQDLPMRCFQKTMEKVHKFNSRMVYYSHCCHPENSRCLSEFHEIIDTQAMFSVAQFDKPSQHQVFTPHLKIPMYFCPLKETPKAPLGTEIVDTGTLDTDVVTNEGRRLLSRVDNIKKENSCCGIGASGSVFRVKLHPNSHKLSTDKDSYFALKECHLPRDASWIFRQYRHSFIVDPLVSWTQAGRYYMLSPFAECNLGQYIATNKFLVNEKPEVLWLLEQFQGLSSALRIINVSSYLPRLHRRIKPDNILFFWATDPPRGTLKITDSIDHIEHRFRSSRIPEKVRVRTQTYKPPEIHTEGRSSRASDVWSLGCVFLELLVWAFWDFEHVKEFSDARTARRDCSSYFNTVDNSFWQVMVEGNAILRPCVAEQIAALDFQLQQNDLDALRLALDVTKRMLEPKPSDRITAREVELRMNNIVHDTRLEIDHDTRSEIGHASSEGSNHLFIPSVFSEKSLVSFLSRSSVEQPPGTVERLNQVFADNGLLQPLYMTAMTKPNIGASRFENNFRRLLKRYAARLRNEAVGQTQKKSARLVGRRTRYIASTVRKKFDDQYLDRAEAMRRLASRTSDVGWDALVEKHLDASIPGGQALSKHKEISISKAEADEQTPIPDSEHDSSSSSESESSGSDSEEDLPLRTETAFDHIIPFLVQSNAFGLLRQELDHFVHHEAVPSGLSLSSISSAIDGNLTIQFTPDIMVAPLSIIDRAKGFFEEKFTAPIIWWPLQSRKTCCAKGFTRISWNCVCGEEIFYDISNQAANQYYKKLISGSLGSTSQPILPIHNPGVGSSTSVDASQSQLGGQSPGRSQRRGAPHSISDGSADHTFRNTPIQQRYVHWCVDAKRYHTELTHIPIDAQNPAFVSKLKSAFNAIRGFRHWLTLTDCHGIKFMAFNRIHRSKDLVVCYKEDLPCPHTNKDYKYSYEDPREMFIKSLEARLLHSLHRPKECDDQDVEAIVDRIPKKVNGRLMNGVDIQGFGMQAIPGWSFRRAMVALFLSQIGPLIFAIRWLCGHPGDLQNAFQLALYLLGLLNIIVIIPDVWSLQKDKEQ